MLTIIIAHVTSSHNNAKSQLKHCSLHAGVFKKPENFDVYVDLKAIPELYQVKVYIATIIIAAMVLYACMHVIYFCYSCFLLAKKIAN